MINGKVTLSQDTQEAISQVQDVAIKPSGKVTSGPAELRTAEDMEIAEAEMGLDHQRRVIGISRIRFQHFSLSLRIGRPRNAGGTIYFACDCRPIRARRISRARRVISSICRATATRRSPGPATPVAAFGGIREVRQLPILRGLILALSHGLTKLVFNRSWNSPNKRFKPSGGAPWKSLQ
jgi:hypothetical protein